MSNDRDVTIKAMMEAFDDSVPGGIAALDERFALYGRASGRIAFYEAMAAALDASLSIDDPHDEQDAKPRTLEIDPNRGDK